MSQPIEFVAIAITPSKRPQLDAASCQVIEQTLPSIVDKRWLAEQRACEWHFMATKDEAKRLGDDFWALAESHHFDLNIVGASSRRKKLLIADMDSTMIEQECIDELAAAVDMKSHVAAITEKAMRGEIAFDGALKERVALLKGVSTSFIDRLIEETIIIQRGARLLVATMKAHGAYCALVSGGFTHFTGPISKAIGFDEHQANQLIVEADCLSGQVGTPILGQEAKLQHMQRLASQRDIDLSECLAVGDGANDLAMITAAGLGVAFHAKPAVAKKADARVDSTDLSSLLFLQGYHEDEFITS